MMELERWLERGGVMFYRLRGKHARGGTMQEQRTTGEVWIWLNRAGEGVVWGAEDRMYLRPGMYAILGDDANAPWKWTRLAGEHDLELVVMSRAWLCRKLGDTLGHVHPRFRDWLMGGGRLAFTGLMTGPELDLEAALRVMDGRRPESTLLAEAKVLEWAAIRLFRMGRHDEGAGFCHRIVRSDPVRRALIELQARIAEPIELDSLGRKCGASPSHLSRLVKQATGLTLREHQRRLRIEMAREMLEGGASVTEVAYEVGYRSLSHFAKAFREETGVLPGRWNRGGESG